VITYGFGEVMIGVAELDAVPVLTALVAVTAKRMVEPASA
jgi:hypothetical protein